jgi:hypothetical protein
MYQTILNFLFKKEYQKLKYAQEKSQVVISDYINKHSVADLVREKMFGYKIDMLDGADKTYTFNPDENILLWIDKSMTGYSVSDFLAQCHELKQNLALPMIMDWQVRQFVLNAALKAPNMDAINFARASVNGVEMIRDEISSLDVEYEERKNAPKVESFDKHAVV